MTSPSDPLLPTLADFIALAEKIVAEHSARLERLGQTSSEFAQIMLRHDIINALIDVRHEAAVHASERAWNTVHSTVLR